MNIVHHFEPRVSKKDLMTDVVLNEELWAELKPRVLAIMDPQFREIFDAGIAFAKTLDVPGFVGQKDFLDPDPDMLDDEAMRVFQNYRDSWWDSLSSSTRRRLRTAITNAAVNGDGVQAVIDALEPQFGPTRARRIAVTETTRLFGQGAQATYRASGIQRWRWLTVEDPRVCIQCGNLDGTEYDIAVEFNPAHVSCRCFPSPIVL